MGRTLPPQEKAKTMTTEKQVDKRKLQSVWGKGTHNIATLGEIWGTAERLLGLWRTCKS